MASLESFVSGSAVVTRDHGEKKITITGAVVEIDGILDGPMGVVTPPSAYSLDRFRFPSAYRNQVSDGDPIYIAADGGYGGIDTGDLCYIILNGTQDIQLASSRENALAGTRITGISGGAVGNVRLVPLTGRHPAGFEIIPSGVSTTNNTMTLASTAYTALTEGDPVYIGADGSYTGADTGETLYIVKNGSNTIKFATTRANAVASTPTTISLGGSGTAGNVRLVPLFGGIPGGYTVEISGSGGLRFDDDCVSFVGDGTDIPVKILEESTAHRFGNDNFTSDNCRFTDGSIVYLNKVYYRVNSRSEGTRTDFDTARGTGGAGAQVTFKDCQIEVDQQYNHLNGKRLVIDGLRWKNFRPDSVDGNQFEMSDALTVAPKGLVIDSEGNAFVRWLTGNFTDNVPVNVEGFGGARVDLYQGNGSRILQLTNPVGDVAKNSGGGVVWIKRDQPVNLLGAVDAGTIYYDAQDTGGTDVNVTIAATDAQAIGCVLTKSAGNGVTAYTDVSSYKIQAVGYGFRKQELAAADVAVVPVARSMTLVADRFPNGDKPAASSLTSAATIDDIYNLIKTHEAGSSGRSDFDSDTPIATIDADGYIVFPDHTRVVLSSTASGTVTVDTETVGSNTRDRITIKCAATLAASAKRLVGIKVGGTDGLITLTSVNASAVLLSDSTGSGARMTVVANDTGDKVAMFKSDGTQIGSTFTATATDKDTEIAISGGNVGSGQKIVVHRAGYTAQVRTLDTSAGGAFSETFGALARIDDPSGNAQYRASDADALVSVTFGTSITNPLATMNIGNKQVGVATLLAEIELGCATDAGLKYLAFGGNQVSFIKSPISGDALYTGAYVNAKRATSTDVNAGILGAIFSSRTTFVDGTNGDVAIVAGINTEELGKALLVDIDLDADEAGTQSLWSKIVNIETLEEHLIDEIGLSPGYAITPSGASAANDTITVSATEYGRMTEGDTIRFSNVGGFGGIVADTRYFVILNGSNTIKVAATRLNAIADTPVPIGITGSGTAANMRMTHQRTVASAIANDSGGGGGSTLTAAQVVAAIKGADFPAVSGETDRLGSLLHTIEAYADILDDSTNGLAALKALIDALPQTQRGEPPTASAIVTAIKGADFPSVSGEADRLGSLLHAIQAHGTPPTAAAIVTALLAETVETGGDTVKQALARMDDLPLITDIRHDLLQTQYEEWANTRVVQAASAGAATLTVAGSDTLYIEANDTFTHEGATYKVTSVNDSTRVVTFTPNLAAAIPNLTGIVFLRADSLVNRIVSAQNDAALNRNATYGLAALKALLDALPTDVPLDDAGVATALLGATVEDTVTVEKTLQIMLAYLEGRISVDDATDVVTIYDRNGDEILSGTVDSEGNRTGVTVS